VPDVWNGRRGVRSKGKFFMPCKGRDIVAGGNAPGMREARSPDPEGVVLLRAGGRKSGMMPPGFDPFRVGPCGGTFSGGVAPGYCIHPLRG